MFATRLTGNKALNACGVNTFPTTSIVWKNDTYSLGAARTYMYVNELWISDKHYSVCLAASYTAEVTCTNIGMLY